MIRVSGVSGMARRSIRMEKRRFSSGDHGETLAAGWIEKSIRRLTRSHSRRSPPLVVRARNGAASSLRTKIFPLRTVATLWPPGARAGSTGNLLYRKRFRENAPESAGVASLEITTSPVSRETCASTPFHDTTAWPPMSAICDRRIGAPAAGPNRCTSTARTFARSTDAVTLSAATL